MAKHADLKTGDGHQRIVRHGHLPEREIMTYIGSVAVRQPRVRDRSTDGDGATRVRFTPAILPRQQDSGISQACGLSYSDDAAKRATRQCDSLSIIVMSLWAYDEPDRHPQACTSIGPLAKLLCSSHTWLQSLP